MGDYAAGTCTVFACPEENRKAALEVIGGHLTHIDWDIPIPAFEPVQFKTTYTDDQARMGFEHDLGPELARLDCSFEIYQEAKYEFDATITMYTPELGFFSSLATQEGARVAIDEGAIDDAIKRTTTRDQLVAELLKATGKAWTEQLEALRNGVKPPTLEEMVAARRRLTKVEEELTHG